MKKWQYYLANFLVCALTVVGVLVVEWLELDGISTTLKLMITTCFIIWCLVLDSIPRR